MPTEKKVLQIPAITVKTEIGNGKNRKCDSKCQGRGKQTDIISGIGSEKSSFQVSAAKFLELSNALRSLNSAV